jgi:hypothetical protein
MAGPQNPPAGLLPEHRIQVLLLRANDLGFGASGPPSVPSQASSPQLAPMTAYPQEITFGELRASGVRDVLVYCRDHKCSHHIAISADRWPDHVRLSDIEPDFVCTACGKRGAEIRPKFSQARMGTG